ncbi:TonB-dependent receptor [Neolewinella lacunae]|uniref:TonB-dependent receptor n=1 Tax=Neolewinella lacunae TaxID=1517758 RepID=A0A923PQX0_9BACT|nr:TonB-dependent receptor [Neolewinella lacunae]MBC6995808.1 TonB-dependent receptor [Neolewinella lacunae]MDN3636499.1 TonB-dependent receptor [Neolewinella lacunae]
MPARQLLETDQKALEINLNPKIYGTFAEIGAGQEVARYFFQVGAAAGTIAKTMSAYDKVYSDQIYGVEPSGRYVCESRIHRMLDHEYNLMVDRLRHDRPDSTFFVFADTVAAINYSRTIRGNGWLGLRFQLDSAADRHNDLLLHVRMLDNDNQLQQQAIGILGVNMIYAAFHYQQDPETLVLSLLDGLKGRVAIDMIVLEGPDFPVDNRLLSLWLVKHGLTDITMFDPRGRSIHPSEFLYRKSIMVVRGSFRPITLVNEDMLKAGYQQFRESEGIDPATSFLLTELTLDNLQHSAELNERDFLHRARLLNAMGQTVALSNYHRYGDLIEYLSLYRVAPVGIVMGVHDLLQMISDKYRDNQDGRLLAAFGEIFTRNVKLYIYPAQQEGSADLMTAHNVPIPEGVKFLYRHLLDSGQIVDITHFHPEHLHIYSAKVLAMIKSGEDGWEKMVPEKAARLIKEENLFEYPSERLAFDY